MMQLQQPMRLQSSNPHHRPNKSDADGPSMAEVYNNDDQALCTEGTEEVMIIEESEEEITVDND